MTKKPPKRPVCNGTGKVSDTDNQYTTTKAYPLRKCWACKGRKLSWYRMVHSWEEVMP